MSAFIPSSRGARIGLAVTLTLVLVAVFLVADFNLGLSRTAMYSGPAHGTSRKVLTITESAGKPDRIPARIQVITYDVEGDDMLSIKLDLALNRELRERPDFTDVLMPDLSGNQTFPMLRVRLKPRGVWLGLFASGTLAVEYSYSTCSWDVEPGADVAFVKVPNNQNSAVASGRIEHEVSWYGPISLEAWRDVRVKPIAKQIVDEVLLGQREVRGLK